MQDLFFYIFAALTLLFGFLVVANPFSRNPVTSAMFLVLTIISMAGLFVLLHAFFLAAVQVLVYAGAVMVLFLFVIMMLDIRASERRHFKFLGAVGGIAVAGLLVWELGIILRKPVESAVTGKTELTGGLQQVLKPLFTNYMLPFEVTALLLLVSMVGVVLLSKKDLK